MKKTAILKFAAVVAGCFALALCLGACGSKPCNEAFVVANVKGANIDVSSVSGEIDKAVETNAFVSVINADGNPKAIEGEGVIGSKSSAPNRRKLENSEWKASMNQVLSDVRATSPECDMVAAIDCARKAFNSPNSYKDKSVDNVICVVSDGFTTKGVGNMADGALFADPHDVVAFYQDELPDLAGVRIVWFNLGSTMAPQPAPSNSTKAVMSEFWKTLLVDGCGASKVEFMDVNVAEPSGDGTDLPTMTIVDVPEVKQMSAAAISKGSKVTLGSQVLYFLPGKADFIDAEAARNVLKPYGEALAADANLTVRIIGSTASDHDRSYLENLSMNRAKATAALLMEFGAKDSQIACEGTGNWGSDHIPDWADEAHNVLEPAAAAANRHITLVFG